MTRSIITIALMCLVYCLGCVKDPDVNASGLKEIVKKARSAGYNVCYNDSMIISLPDMHKITNPNIFGTSECMLENDSMFIKKLRVISTNSQGLLHTSRIQALKIGITALEKAYGEDVVQKEAPFVAELVDSNWIVSGTIHSGLKGGVGKVIIAGSTGNVISIDHGK